MRVSSKKDWESWLGGTEGTPLEKATRFATGAHAPQIRRWTGEPYIFHPWRVMIRVKDAFSQANLEHGTGEASSDLLIACLLHDVVEDCGVLPGFIVDVWGATVANLVDCCTDLYTKKAYPNLNRAKRKQAECERIVSAPLDVIPIKCADFLDNLESIGVYAPEFAETYKAEKRMALEVFELGLQVGEVGPHVALVKEVWKVLGVPR